MRYSLRICTVVAKMLFWADVSFFLLNFQQTKLYDVIALNITKNSIHHFAAHKSLTTFISSLILLSQSSLAQWPSRLKYEPIIAACDLPTYSLTFSLVTPDPIKIGDLHLLWIESKSVPLTAHPVAVPVNQFFRWILNVYFVWPFLCMQRA